MSKTLRVAVTGGNGRIGRQVVRKLLGDGHQVTILDRFASDENGAARFVYADVRRREIIQPVFERSDAVIHLGEIPSVDMPFPPEEIFATNTAAGSTVFQTAADLKIPRLLYVSSAQVYGCYARPAVPPLRLPLDETHPTQPQNAYAAGKVANELYARLLAEHRGLSVAIFRLPYVMVRDISSRWVNYLRREEKDLDGLGSFVHVSDVAELFALAVKTPRPGCEIYNAAADDVMCLSPIRTRLMKQFPDGPTLPEDWPDHKSPALSDKAREHFGWRPRLLFQELLKQSEYSIP